jgi:hypothetical protein
MIRWPSLFWDESNFYPLLLIAQVLFCSILLEFLEQWLWTVICEPHTAIQMGTTGPSIHCVWDLKQIHVVSVAHTWHAYWNVCTQPFGFLSYVSSFRPLDPSMPLFSRVENEGSRMPQNVCIFVPDYIASHRRKPQSSDIYSIPCLIILHTWIFCIVLFPFYMFCCCDKDLLALNGPPHNRRLLWLGAHLENKGLGNTCLMSHQACPVGLNPLQLRSRSETCLALCGRSCVHLQTQHKQVTGDLSNPREVIIKANSLSPVSQ